VSVTPPRSSSGSNGGWLEEGSLGLSARCVPAHPEERDAGRAIRSGMFDVRHLSLHGHQIAYRVAGEGQTLILLHGIAGHSRTWLEPMRRLAERYRLVAPDLLGHGDSDKPVGDYSLGAHACVVRDLLQALGIVRATLVGHSLGGGIALQLTYQFPDLCERMVLVASGGSGAT